MRKSKTDAVGNVTRVKIRAAERAAVDEGESL